MNKLRLTVKVSKSLGVVTEYQTEKIYGFEGDCKRLSGTIDTFKVTYSSSVYKEITEGFYNVDGCVRRTKDGTYVYATSIKKVKEPKEYINEVELIGEVSKPPHFRITSKTETSITDIFIKVMRNSVKFDTLQCIAWNKYAHFAKGLGVGDIIHIYGRLQSKVYTDGKRAAEISCSNIEIIKEDSN